MISVRRTVAMVLMLLLGTEWPCSADPPTSEYLIGYMGANGSGGEIAHVLGMIRPDGSGEKYPEFQQPNQKSWVFGPQFSDGRRIILCSFEDVSVAQVRSGKVVTHDWIYNLHTGVLVPAMEKNRQADQLRPYILLPGDQRVIETAYIGTEERIFIKDLDGDHAAELTAAGGGFHYALALSHDATRLACHVTGGKADYYNPGTYSINVFDLATGKRTLVAGQPEHLMFGPNWSADDAQLVYLDCQVVRDPGHFRADLCVGKTDGSEHRVITSGQSHWFGTPFGSNMAEWSPDGRTVTYTRLSANATRDMAAGGSQLCLLDPVSGMVDELTPAIDGTWDFRASWCPDGSQIAFIRVCQGAPRELWIMNRDGSDPRRLTDGYQHKGADHIRWIREAH